MGAFLALSGLAYLAYKAKYLGLDAPDALKAFIVLPGAALLVAAAFVAFPDARRRVGGALLALGLVALLWLAREPLPGGGWTFYTPLSSVETSRPLSLKGPEPVLTAFAVVLPLLGLATCGRRSVLGGILFGMSLWTALCLAPSRAAQLQPYAYPDDPVAFQRRLWSYDRSDAVLPIVFGLLGTGLIVRPKKRRGRGDDVPAPSSVHDAP